MDTERPIKQELILAPRKPRPFASRKRIGGMQAPERKPLPQYFKPGNAGRPPGPNKMTKEVKMVIAECFENIGGKRAFAMWAKEHPTEFYRLYAKLLPIQLQGTGANGEFTFTVTRDEAAL